jgi:hypothetical protein
LKGGFEGAVQGAVQGGRPSFEAVGGREGFIES